MTVGSRRYTRPSTSQPKANTAERAPRSRSGAYTSPMEPAHIPIHTDFTGYEGQYVALDWRTGEVVLADQDPQVVLREAKDRDHVVVQGRVPYPDEPTRIY
jgi:hypothetical protein